MCFTARAGEPELADVNPDVAELYRRKLKRLAEELAEDPSSEVPAIALRSLIGEVVLTPEEKRTFPSAHVGHGEISDNPRFDGRSRDGRPYRVRRSIKSENLTLGYRGAWFAGHK